MIPIITCSSFAASDDYPHSSLPHYSSPNVHLAGAKCHTYQKMDFHLRVQPSTEIIGQVMTSNVYCATHRDGLDRCVNGGKHSEDHEQDVCDLGSEGASASFVVKHSRIDIAQRHAEGGDQYSRTSKKIIRKALLTKQSSLQAPQTCPNRSHPPSSRSHTKSQSRTSMHSSPTSPSSRPFHSLRIDRSP